MADNVAITAGAGTSIAADDVASVFYQKVKLDGGGDGATAPIIGDTANGLDVDVTRLPALVAGAATIGNVGVNSVAGNVATTNAAASQVDGHSAAIGATTDAAAVGNGSVIGILKQERVLLAGGLPAALGGAGGLKVDIVGGGGTGGGDVNVLTLPPLVAGTANIGDVDVLSLPALPAGTNNIGDVDVITMPSITIGTMSALVAGTANIGDVDVLTLPALVAGTANIGDVDIVTMPSVTIGTMAALVAGTANIGDVDVLTLPALVAGTANIGDVDVLTLPALPTGTNVIGYTREYLARSRLNVVIYIEAYVVTAADVLTTTQRSINCVAPTGATSHSVTASKIWRFSSITLTWTATSATIASASVRLRANTAGAAVIGSPIVFTSRIGASTGTLASPQCWVTHITIPDGIEFAASTGIGLTIAGSAAQGQVTVAINGYEYDV